MKLLSLVKILTLSLSQRCKVSVRNDNSVKEIESTWFLQIGLVATNNDTISNSDPTTSSSSSTPLADSSSTLTTTASSSSPTASTSTSLTTSSTDSTIAPTTIPEPPDGVNIYNVKKTSFRVEWTDKNSHYTQLRVVVEPYSLATNFSAGCENNDKSNCTFGRNVTAVDITGLVSGTYYTVKLYSVVNGTSSERAAENHTYTLPEPPDGVIIYSVKENSFRVVWVDKNTSYTHLRIVVDPGSPGINFSARCSNPNESSCIFERNATAIDVTGLVSGTNYSVRLYSVVNGTSSDRAAENHTYTLPEPPNGVNIYNVKESSFSVKWTDTNTSYTQLRIVVEPNSIATFISAGCANSDKSICTFERNGTTAVNITGLVSGTYYTVKLYSVINGTSSERAAENHTYTLPEAPDEINILAVKENSFTVEWTSTNTSYTHLKIFVDPGSPTINFSVACEIPNKSNCTFEKNITAVNITRLASGTYYTVKLYSVVNGTSSERAAEDHAYTLSEPPDRVSIHNATENSFRVEWTGTNTSYTHLKLVVDPGSPAINFSVGCANNDTRNCTFEKNVTAVDITGLVSGTYYTVKLYSIINGTSSDRAAENQKYTLPKPPDRVNIYNVKSNSFRVEWTGTNTSYTHLKLVVDPGSPAINFSAVCANPNQNNCTFEKNVTAVDITGLVSGTYYTVKLYSVINGTSSERAAEDHTYTLSEPPDGVSIHNVTENSFRVELTSTNTSYTHVKLVVDPGSPAINFSVGCANNDTRNCTFEKNVTAVDITGLVSGTYYTVKLYSVINGTSSERAAENQTYTLPEPPDGVNINNVKENSFEVEWTVNNKSFTHVRIIVDPYSPAINFSNKCKNPDISNCTFERNVTAVNVTGLLSGTHYAVKIYSVINGTSSVRVARNQTFTLPEHPDGISIKNVKANSFEINWVDEKNKSYTHLNIVVQPNTTALNFSVECVYNNKSSCTFVRNVTTVNITGLLSGTHYTVKLYSIVNGTSSELAAENDTYTMPEHPGGISIENVRANSFTINWVDEKNKSYTHLNIVVQPNSTALNFSVECVYNNKSSCTFVRNVTTVNITGLLSGTHYTVKLYSIVNGTSSELAAENDTYTMPEHPGGISIENVRANNFTINWVDERNKSYTHLNIVVQPNSTALNFSVECVYNNKSSCTFVRNVTTVNITGLMSGTHYTVKLYSIVNGTSSELAAENDTYTMPEHPGGISIENVRANNFTINWVDERNKSYTHLNIVVQPNSTALNFSVECVYNNKSSCTFVRNVTTVNITGLMSGTHYTVKLYSIVNGTSSELAAENDTYTKQVYNETCKFMMPEEPCITRNATCRNDTGTCLCGDDWFYLINGDKCVPKIDVDVSKLSLNVTRTETHAIELQCNIPKEPPDLQTIVVETVRVDDGSKKISRTPQNSSENETYQLRIESLQPGTNYSLKCYPEYKNNVPSLQSVTKFAVTYPVPLSSPTKLYNISQTSFVLSWTDNASLHYTHLRIVISPNDTSLNPTKNCIGMVANCTLERSPNETSIEYYGLKPGTFYTVVMYTMVADLVSEAGPNITTYTRPQPPQNCVVTNVTSSSVTITWETNKETSLKINVSPQDVCDNGTCTVEVNPNTTSYDIDGLQAGTSYNLSIYTIIGDLLTDTPVYLNATTRPGLAIKAEIAKVTESSFELQWTDNGTEQYTNLSIVFHPSPPGIDTCIHYNNTTGNCTVERNSSRINVTGLLSGTYYIMIIYSINNGLLSDRNIFISTYTRPPQLLNCSAQSVTSTMVTVMWINYHTVQYTSISIEVCQQNVCENGNRTVGVNASTTSYDIKGLTAGTIYNLSIYTIIGVLLTNSPVHLNIATRPGLAKNISLVNTTANSIAITWERPDDGKVDDFLVEFRCESPNKYSNITKNQTHSVHNQPGLMSTASSLDPGTVCKVSITAVFWNQTGETVNYHPNQTSSEIAPGYVKFSRNSTSSRSFNITWIKPDEPNGIVRQYMIRVIDTYHQCLMEEQVLRNCTDCDGDIRCQGEKMENMAHCDDYSLRPNGTFEENDEHSFSTESSMHPYRNYTVSVRAYTRCWGSFTNTSLLTDEDVPAAAPIAKILNITADTTTIEWTDLTESDRNGIIIEYTLRYEYINNSCFQTDDGTVQSEEVSVNSTSNRTYLQNLRPFWIYNFTISASTSKGKGVFSTCTAKICNVRTLESAPGNIKPDSVRTEQTSTTVNLSWDVPCRPNGIITHYTYRILNLDEPADTVQDNTTTNNTDCIIQHLHPYRNYSISIAANTAKGPGNFTTVTNVSTSITKPYNPNKPQAKALTSASLEITWQALPQINYTGPTSYEVKAIDTKDNSSIWNCSSSGYNSTKCIIDGLDEYWNYNIEITAYTKAGNATSEISTGRTDEAKPGKVQTLILSPETNITQPRSIVVAWAPPKERDLNGIITNYYLTFTNQNYSSQDIINIKSDAEKRYVYDKIKPGFYNVSIYAATVAGNGSYEINSTTVQPGAPIPLPPDPGNPIIKSGGNVNDNTKQISVQLALKRWLCNTTNGDPIDWGVVVAHKDQAIDPPFIGSPSEFSSRKTDVYKKWSDIKHLKSVPPYIATPPNWSPCLKVQRRKRSTEIPETQQFVVGESGQCSGTSSQDYCNGELQPGTIYRVKTFVCTAGGCSESEYSEPISTAADQTPDLTVPIAAGLSSAVIVLAAVVVVVILLKRRQKACFAKDVDDDKITHVRGNDMLLDKIERPKPNAFKPGAVKLSEFPAYVEKMHKDSDLLFADAYRLLRENSPKHLTTAAEQQSCRPKNRYTDILPFDHSRVKILPVDDIEGSDYINANYIPGYTSPREYIAAQGPMQAVFDDFWRMVWEQNVDTIVMLTKLVEKGRRKCDQYWPELSEPQFYGDLVVNVQSESNMSDYVIRIFEVKLKDTKKTVRHFSYLKWPDMGCPETPELLLEFVKAVRQYTSKHNTSKTHGPTLVHCSAGVGRTGTFIAVDILLQHIRDHDEVDIYNLVLDLRNHRLRMIQTEDQYVYVHECVKAFITTDEEEEEEQDHLYMNYPGAEYVEEENAYENTAFSTNMDKLTML